MNLSDKELDRLSREAAEKYEVEKDFGAWNKLEQLLDKEMGRSSPVPRFIRPGNPFIYFPALAVLIGSIFFIIKPSKNTENSTLKNASLVNKKVTGSAETKTATDSADNSINNKPSANLHEVAKNNSMNENKVINKGGNISTNKNTNSASSENINEERNNAVNNSSSSINNKKEKSFFAEKNNKEKNTADNNTTKSFTNSDGYAENNIRSSKDKNFINKNHSIKNNHSHSGKINKEGNDINNTETNNFSSNNNQQHLIDKTADGPEENLQFINIGGIQSLHNNIYLVNDSILNNLSMQETGLTNINKNNRSKKLYTNRSLQIGVLFSPDFSEVKEDYVNKVGSNIGVTLSYQLTNRFSINSGLISTNKYYTVNGHDFHAPAGYWSNRVDLEFVKGNCHMLEIPLNIRYDFNKNNNTTFFVSSGLSSYLLKNENYAYFFRNYNFGPVLNYQRSSYKTDHNYWLSVLNLSAGFETKISNSFSFQVEPYVKLPLTGIGFGKVDLSSYGINLSVKFAPLLSRSRH